MPTPDPNDWLLNDADWARVEDMDGGVHDADNIVRAQLLKAMKGFEGYVRELAALAGAVDKTFRECAAYDKLADDLASARARLESEGK